MIIMIIMTIIIVMGVGVVVWWCGGYGGHLEGSLRQLIKRPLTRAVCTGT